MTYEERLRELKLPSLTNRRRRGDMIFTYKILTTKTNMNKEDFFAMTHLTTRGHLHIKCSDISPINFRASTLSRSGLLTIGTNYHRT